jgi:arylsulfatase A-like enzyme
VARGSWLVARRVDHPVESLDILPTLLELLEIEVDGEVTGEVDGGGGSGGGRGLPMQGRSLVAAMRGDGLRERAILAETEMFTQYVADSLTLGPWKLIADRSGGLQRSSTGEITLRPRVMARGEPGEYLFDRNADPSERVDVAHAHPEIAEQMRVRLAAMLAAATTRRGAREASPPPSLSRGELGALRALGYLEDDPDI